MTGLVSQPLCWARGNPHSNRPPRPSEGAPAELLLTRELSEATLAAMSRPSARKAAADTTARPSADAGSGPADDGPLAASAPPPQTPVAAAALGSLADLPVAGLTRRRIGLLVGAIVAAWVIVLFARQVSEAAGAAQVADAMRASNAALQANVDALTRERFLIQREAYIDQQAREYRLGTTREIPFILADDAPVLGPDAPGSAGVKLGARADTSTPLDSWLRVLFGPDGSSTAR